MAVINIVGEMNRCLYIHVCLLLCLNADLEIGDSKRDILVSREGFRSETKVAQVVSLRGVD